MKYLTVNLTKSFIYSAQAVQNLGLATTSILAGIIVDRGGYFMLEMFFLGWLWSMCFLRIAISMRSKCLYTNF